jgi:hypothetical protein
MAPVFTPSNWLAGATICIPACRANSGMEFTASSEGTSNGLACAQAAEAQDNASTAAPHVKAALLVKIRIWSPLMTAVFFCAAR